MNLVYTNGAFGNLAPVVDQPYADRVVNGAEVVVRSPCPIVAVRLVFRGTAPTADVSIAGAAAEPTEPMPGEPGEGRTTANLYPVTGAPSDVTIAIPEDARLAVSTRTKGAHVTTADGYVPAARVLCVTPHNEAYRFRQTFRRGHPALTRAQVAFFPRAWAVLGWSAAAIAIVNAARRRNH
jgi:hypothetical protein